MRPFDAYGNFATSVITGGGALRRSTVRGAGATIFAGVATLAIQVGATMILARLLTPVDFGLIAMVTTFSLLLVNFGFNGLTEAIVQCETMDHTLASTLFWINVGFGALLTLAFAEVAPLLARFFHTPEVTRVAVGMSLTIFANSLSTVHLALLKRGMMFSKVSANDIAARFVSVIVSIVLGLMGYGYWALIVGAIAVPVSTCIGAYGMCRWMPGRPAWNAETTSASKFALNTYGNFAVNYMSRNTDNLLVGWRFNAQSLGYYKKAYDLFALSAGQLVSSIAVVVVTALSRVRRNPALYRRYLVDAIAVMALIGMGMGTVLTLAGKDLILVLLGPKWEPAGEIFTFFGPGIGIMVLYCTHGWIHLSVGRADRWFRWGILEFAITCGFFIAGLPWGPVGIATAWSVSTWVLTIPAIWYAGKPIDLPIGDVLSAVWRYFAASLGAFLFSLFLMHQFLHLVRFTGTPGAVVRLMLISALGTLSYLAAVVILHGGFKPLFQIAGLLNEMRPGNRSLDKNESEPPEGNFAPAPFELPASYSEAVPLVSVLIPAYNAEEWIADTIASALAQTWPRIEIIVVDDGSKDRTPAIARQFEPHGVRVIEQRNQGASAARNTAFAHSHGEYIQWLDADDLLSPDKIARQMQLVMEGLSPRTLLTSSWGHFKYRPHKAEFKPTPLWCDLTPREWLLRKMSLNIFMQTGTWLVSREITQAAGPWDIRLLGDDDGEYFCRVLMASNGVRFVSEARVYYRAFRFDGLSYIGRFPDKIEAHWLSMQLHIKYLRSLTDDARARAACAQYLDDSLVYFYPEKTQIVRQANELAAEFEQSLKMPQLTWKYAWVEFLFGWHVTKIVQHVFRRVRWRLAKKIDYVLFRLEGLNGSLPATFPDKEDRTGAKLEPAPVKES